MKRLLILAAGCALVCLGAQGQISLGGPKVTYTAATEANGVAAGGALKALVLVSLSPNWHVNANKPLEDFLIPTELVFTAADGVSASEVVYPEHKLFKTKFQDQPLAVYEEKFAIEVAIAVAADATPGPRLLKGTLRYQACNDTQCSPPKDVPVEVAFEVLAAGTEAVANDLAAFKEAAFKEAAVVPAPEEKAPTVEVPATSAAPAEWKKLLEGFTVAGEVQFVSTDEFLQWIDDSEKGVARGNLLEGRGFFGILLVVLLGGFLLNLTPCVLPLIPINLAILGAGARAGSKSRGFVLGGVYGLGIALVYGALGLLVVLGLSTAFGTINSTVWFNGGIAVLFIVLGLAMFDVFQIDFTRFQGYFGVRKQEKGSLGLAFGMGAISALLAGACVAPALIATLLYSQAQYAAGNVAALALPFLLGVGMAAPWPFAGAGLSFLPKPGGWMDLVKKGMGVFIILMGAYYLYTAYGIYQERNVDRAEVSASAKEAAEQGWETSLEAGLAKAKAEGKPVLIDFWATWCKNCLVMNKTTLKDERVLKALDGYVKIKYQAESPDVSPVKEVWEEFKLVGLPTYVILKP